MITDKAMGYMLSNAYKRNKQEKTEKPLKKDLTQDEALKIFNEVLEVYRKHNISYQCACKVTMALNHAMLTGAAELYEQEQIFNP